MNHILMPLGAGGPAAMWNAERKCFMVSEDGMIWTFATFGPVRDGIFKVSNDGEKWVSVTHTTLQSGVTLFCAGPFKDGTYQLSDDGKNWIVLPAKQVKL